METFNLTVGSCVSALTGQNTKNLPKRTFVLPTQRGGVIYNDGRKILVIFREKTLGKNNPYAILSRCSASENRGCKI